MLLATAFLRFGTNYYNLFASERKTFNKRDEKRLLDEQSNDDVCVRVFI